MLVYHLPCSVCGITKAFSFGEYRPISIQDDDGVIHKLAFKEIPWGDYLQKLRNDGEWGDHLCLAALSALYSSTIYIVCFKDIHNSIMTPVHGNSTNDIYLFFTYEYHYDSMTLTPD